MELEPNIAVLDWPLGPDKKGREVWYLLATTRDGETAFWYHIEFVSTGTRNVARTWAAITSKRHEDAFVSRAVDIDTVIFQELPFRLVTPDARLRSTGASGRIDGQVPVSWELEHDPDTYAFTPLRSSFLTNFLANTVGTGNHWSRNQSVEMNGTVTVGDRTIRFREAPGHQGHTVGRRAPPDLTWVHCNDFDTTHARASDISLEALQYGRFCSICLRVDERIYAFNRLYHLLPGSPRRNKVEHNEVGDWQFRTSGGDVGLRGTVQADPYHWQLAAQYSPDGSLHYDAHCPFASLTLTYSTADDWTTVKSDRARVEWVKNSQPIKGEYEPNWQD